MTSEKVVVALLLITIILSIVSVVVTFSLDANERPVSVNKRAVQGDLDDVGNVQLVIEETPSGGTE